MMTVGRRWQKYGHDRVYVNAETMEKIMYTEGSNTVNIRNKFNRFERNNMKVFYDVTNDEFVVTHGDDSAKAELIAVLRNIIGDVDETEDETTETIKTEDETTNRKGNGMKEVKAFENERDYRTWMTSEKTTTLEREETPVAIKKYSFEKVNFRTVEKAGFKMYSKCRNSHTAIKSFAEAFKGYITIIDLIENDMIKTCVFGGSENRGSYEWSATEVARGEWLVELYIDPSLTTFDEDEETEDEATEKVIWYAVTCDDYTDWDYGSLDRAEAIEMLKEQGEGQIAVIDDEDKFCLDVIDYEDVAD